MSTANFHSMTDFPLIVAEDEYSKICPECGLANCGDADKCDDCGCDLADVESKYDDLATNDNYENMKWYAERMNDEQDFFTVSVKSGYYSGLQFYVEAKYDGLDNWNDEDAEYEFGKSLAEVKADYAAAEKIVTDGLNKAKDDLALVELACVGVFSNGEAVYRKVA